MRAILAVYIIILFTKQKSSPLLPGYKPGQQFRIPVSIFKGRAVARVLERMQFTMGYQFPQCQPGGVSTMMHLYFFPAGVW
jgi:hypothetical protein